MSNRQCGATERALNRIVNGETAYKAAKAEGVALSTIYRALKRPFNEDAILAHASRNDKPA